MKKLLFLLLHVVMFFIIGELVAQIHQVLQHTDFKTEIKNKLDQSFEIKDSVNAPKNKIFILGDSYTIGVGIESKNSFPFKLSKKYYNIFDISSGGDNWDNYYSKILDIKKRINKNDILLIGVNFKDFNFQSGIINKIFNNYYKNKLELPDKKFPTQSLNHTKRSRNLFVEFLYTIERNSKLINLLRTSLSYNLAKNNIFLPIGDVYYFKEYAYNESDKSKEFNKVFNLFDELHNEGIIIILILYPLFNYAGFDLDYGNNFQEYFINNSLNRYSVINGFKLIYDSQTIYCINKFDGHPNAAAHEVILKNVITIIDSLRTHLRN